MAKKILIITNDLLPFNQLKESLEAIGYEIIMATDGITGLHKVNMETPDLIVIDYMLPQINGYGVCSLLKRDIRYRDLPVIMTTIFSNDHLGDGKEKPDFIFHRPFNIEAMVAKIKELLAIADAKKEEAKKQLAEQAEKWLRQHYIPGLEGQGIFSR
jgi:DNA-binding response OmpR family regulator|uniref:Response regulator n=1 Tax=candidate division WOR-3 bacterium TaxID=2052148 RepID=A0A7C6ECP2_UNCW3